jgi:hypothetical protein
VQSVGKGVNHIPTTAECSTCHLVSLPWSAAHYDHAGITDNCARCHDNIHAPGKPLTHVPTMEACEVCHSPSNFVTFAGTEMNHVGITSNCQSCHETGMQWYGVMMVDRPTLGEDPYHPTATSPGGADCANCHAGFMVGDFAKLVKPPNHIPTAQVPCINCHVLTDMSATVGDPPQCAVDDDQLPAVSWIQFVVLFAAGDQFPDCWHSGESHADHAVLRGLPRRRRVEHGLPAGAGWREIHQFADESRRSQHL